MDEFCGVMGEEARSELGAISLQELRVAAEVVTGRRALMVPAAPMAASGTGMDEEKLAAVIERALRNWIGICHSEACMARLRRACRREIEQRDANYEDALEAYRQVVGKEPTSR